MNKQDKLAIILMIGSLRIQASSETELFYIISVIVWIVGAGLFLFNDGSK